MFPHQSNHLPQDGSSESSSDFSEVSFPNSVGPLDSTQPGEKKDALLSPSERNALTALGAPLTVALESNYAGKISPLGYTYVGDLTQDIPVDHKLTLMLTRLSNRELMEMITRLQNFIIKKSQSSAGFNLEDFKSERVVEAFKRFRDEIGEVKTVTHWDLPERK